MTGEKKTPATAVAGGLRELFPDAATRPLVAGDPPFHVTGISEAARALVPRLRAPILLHDLLAAASGAEVDTLAALAELHHAGRLRRLPSTLDAVPLASPGQEERLRMTVVLGVRCGFENRVRVVFAGALGRLSIFAHATLCIAGAKAPGEGVPAVPMPHVMARIAVGGATSDSPSPARRSRGEGEAIDLDLVGLPLVPAFAPLWPMALSGAAVVVRLDEAAGSLLNEACEAVGAKIVDAHALVGSCDETNASEVANLVRASLDWPAR